MGKNKVIPIYDSPIIETHCHLDYLKEKSREEILSLCTSHGIEKLITISVSPKNLDTALEIAEQHSHIYCSQGIHPHEAKDWNEQVEIKIKKSLSGKKVVAVGEIGLDYYYDNSPRDKQLLAFNRQLELAIEENLPVIIHSRDADEDTLSTLQNHSSQLTSKGVIHSFTSGVDLARQAIKMGFYLGFNGIITFKSAKNVRDIVRLTPIENILLETDSPFLTPTPFRGKENAPYYLPLVAQAISEIKQLPIEVVLEKAYQNSHQLFSKIRSING